MEAVMSVGKGSKLEDLKISIPQVTWGLFTWISGYQGFQMLWAGQSITGAANVLISLGLLALTLNWPRVVFYFASRPAVLRMGTLALALFLGIHFFVQRVVL
jgi:hypothetical protein